MVTFMRAKIILVIVVISIFALSFLGQWLLLKYRHNAQVFLSHEVKKIVSLSPSVTELLFDLGLENRIVGVTDFCKYPPEALNIDKIGGYLDVNYEAIVSLKPDIVIMRKEFQQAKERLESLNIRTLTVNHDDIQGILDSYNIVGAACGAEQKASVKVEQIKQRMSNVSAKTKNLPLRKVMICIEREYGKSDISGVIAVGKDGFYNEILRLAGGKSLFEETGIPFPPVSAESILRANPDIIIEMIPDIGKRGLNKDDIIKDWQTLHTVEAVKNGKVFILIEDYFVIPGPRFVMIIEEMAKLIHPEARW